MEQGGTLPDEMGQDWMLPRGGLPAAWAGTLFVSSRGWGVSLPGQVCFVWMQKATGGESPPAPFGFLQVERCAAWSYAPLGYIP